MGVGWDLRLKERYGVTASCLTEIVEGEAWALARMHGSSSLQVRKREVRLAVPTVGRPEQRKERCVLAQGQELAIAPRPSLWGEVEREDTNLCDERIHISLLGLGREDPEQRNDEVDT